MELRINPTDENILLHGRTTLKDGFPAFDWPNSGLTFKFRGESASICFSPFLEPYTLYLRVTIDGESHRVALSTGNERVIVEGLPNKLHTLELLKVTESPFRICVTEIILTGITPVLFSAGPLNKPKIEFLGDSLTAGYGNLSEPTVSEYSTAEQDSTRAFAYITARLIGAEGHYECISGKGIFNSCNGSKEYQIPEFFTHASFETKEPWDFESWVPDIVVINAGTNDYAGKVSDADFESAAREFLGFIRKKYENAYIIWAYGMTRSNASELLRSLIEDIADPKISFLSLPSMTEFKDEIGGNGHPNVKSHIRTAKFLAKYIKRVCGIPVRALKHPQ